MWPPASLQAASVSLYVKPRKIPNFPPLWGIVRPRGCHFHYYLSEYHKKKACREVLNKNLFKNKLTVFTINIIGMRARVAPGRKENVWGGQKNGGQNSPQKSSVYSAKETQKGGWGAGERILQLVPDAIRS